MANITLMCQTQSSSNMASSKKVVGKSRLQQWGAHLCANYGHPRTRHLVIVIRQELLVANLQVNHFIPQLWHIHAWHAPAHLHDSAESQEDSSMLGGLASSRYALAW